MFEQLRQLGAARGLVPAIYTFREHPKEVLCGLCPPLLTTPDERFRLLEHEGELHVRSFAEIRRLTAAEFMQRLHADRKSVV